MEEQSNKNKPKTNKERLLRLETVFSEQSVIAINSNKIRGIATMKVICDLANVDTNYVYGHIECPPDIAARYKSFHDRVVDFNQNFVSNKKKLNEHAVSEIQKYKQSVDQNHQLLKDKTDLQAQLERSKDKVLKLMAEKTHLQAIATESNISSERNLASISDITITIISPDSLLEHDGKYNFHNSKARDKAWSTARAEFARLMKRKVPQRVYLLVGPPCSGKSTWAKKKDLYKDRHAVIIDATNLTAGERATWIMQSQKANDVKICVVRFLTDYVTLAARNLKRSHKKIDPDILENKFNSVEEVDPSFEEIDEVIYVRDDNEY